MKMQKKICKKMFIHIHMHTHIYIQAPAEMRRSVIRLVAKGGGFNDKWAPALEGLTSSAVQDPWKITVTILIFFLLRVMAECQFHVCAPRVDSRLVQFYALRALFVN